MSEAWEGFGGSENKPGIHGGRKEGTREGGNGGKEGESQVGCGEEGPSLGETERQTETEKPTPSHKTEMSD